MPAYAFSTLDVFTDTLFGGNPLAVFHDADDLAPEHMQAIAQELNLSETVFILRPRSPAAVRRLRIFTPGVELPFAGHPTIGTALLLADLGVVEPEGTFTLEEAAGLIEVSIAGVAGAPTATLTAAGRPTVQACPATQRDLAHMLGLEVDDLVVNDVTPTLASAGVPFVLVGVRDLDALNRARMHPDRWPTVLRDRPQHVYVVALPDAGGVHARMFAPSMNIVEDPATGAAASALAAALGRGRADGTHRWTVTQGVQMNRRSRLDIEAVVEDRAVTAVRVGGQAVRVSDGTFRLP